MKTASLEYLTELADDFLSGQTAIEWRVFEASALKGESTWIDPTRDEPGVEIAMSYRRLPDAIEIEVVAYQPDEDGHPTTSVRRVGEVRRSG